MARAMLTLGAACSLLACHAGVLSPLSAAARAGDSSVMGALLDRGADPNAAGRDGTRWPPLMHAVHTRQFEAARLLLDRGADPNVSSNGYTALMIAADDGDARLLALLLDYGADAYAQGPGGMTALTAIVAGGAITDIDRPLGGDGYPAALAVLLASAPDLQLPSNAAGRDARLWARVHARVEQARNIAAVPPSGAAPATSCHDAFATAENR
jgi:ankyrin repeat protein